MLTFEATHEYNLSNPSLFYCDTHATLRVCDNFTDSVLVSGITRKDVNYFIEKYFEYVLEQDESTELAKAFKQVTKGKEKSAKGASS